MIATVFGGRVEASPRSLGLALGDAAMIALFVLLGELRHGGTLSAGVSTFGQFALGWVLVAVVAGAYAADALATPRRAVVWGVGTWVLAALVGQLIRLLMRPGSVVQPTFVLVAIAFGGLFIGAWRYVAARAVSRRGESLS